MLSKEAKIRIKRNKKERIQNRQVRYLRKYFVDALLIPMGAIAACGGVRPGVFQRLGIPDKQFFLSRYAIAYYPSHSWDPYFISGQFIRSQRDPTFGTFLINMKTHKLQGLSVQDFTIDLVARRRYDTRKRLPSGLDTSMYYQPYAIPLTPQGNDDVEQASEGADRETVSFMNLDSYSEFEEDKKNGTTEGSQGAHSA